MAESIVLVTTADDINIAKSADCPVSGVNRTKTFGDYVVDEPWRSC
jgi:hypothetical protein